MQNPFGTPTGWLGLAAFGLVAGLAAPDADAQRNVTLRLNTASIPDTVDVNDFVEVRGGLVDTSTPNTLPDGNILDWNAASTIEPMNIGGDYWEVSFQIPDNQAMQFKFWNGEDQDTPIGDWENDSNLESNNYEIAAGTGDVTRDLHYFNKTGMDQPYDWRPFEPSGPDSVAVWFRVYANTEALNRANFDPSGDDFEMAVRGDGALGGAQGGDVIDWGASNISLQREGASGSNGFQIWSGRVAFPNSAIGMEQAYKFVAQDADNMGDQVGWEDVTGGGNRLFNVPAQDTTLHLAYFGDAAPVTDEVITQAVVFRVDAQPLVDVDVLDRGRGDGLQVRGGFNSWSCANEDICLLGRIPGAGSEVYVRSVDFTAVDGAEFVYKYFADLQLDFAGLEENEISDFGYEEPLDFGGGDRTFDFDASGPNNLETQFFNSIRPANVIGDQGEITVNFEVDMRPALDFAGEEAFDPAEDDVYVTFEDKVWETSQGFTPDQIVNEITEGDVQLSDADGDGIYTGSYQLQTPTYNGIGYRYAFGDAEAATLTIEGEGGFAPGRRRYRYVLPSGGSFPSSFSFARDTFRPTDEPTPYEANPTDPDRQDKIDNDPLVIESGEVDTGLAVEEVPGEVAEAAEAVAFPNPTAATATIRYDVPHAGAVSLRVFDLVGREVAVLVDAEQAAAKYEATFDASALAPGVYVYRLTAAGQAVSGKLTVVR
jgi:hypothetical protein